MNRLLKEGPASQSHTGTRHEQPPLSGPQKGEPAGKPKVGAVETATAHYISWEASDQHLIR